MVECKACGKEIAPTESKLTDAAQDTYHSDCFVCAKCGDKLAGKQFYTVENEKICKDCYTNKVAPRCVKCEEPCLDSVTKFNNENYHPNCFTCAKCGNPIEKSSLIGRDDDNKPIHAPSCEEAGTKPKCNTCGKQFGAGETYYTINGIPTCKPCKDGDKSETAEKDANVSEQTPPTSTKPRRRCTIL